MPAKAGIQQSLMSRMRLNTSAGGYWIIRLRG